MHARTLYDAAHERGLTTAQVDWVAIQNAPTITWEFPERPDPKGAIAQEAVKTGILSQADLETFHTKNILWRDHIWTQAAAHPASAPPEPAAVPPAQPGLDAAPLRSAHAGGDGCDGAPRLAGCHHRDDAREDRPLANTTLFVVSDHGFKAVKRQIRPNVVFAKLA